MRKTISLVLVFAMVMALVPTSLAVKALPQVDPGTVLTQDDMKTLSENTATNFANENSIPTAIEAKNTLAERETVASKAAEVNASEVAKKNTVIHASDLAATKEGEGTGWLASPRNGFEMVEQENTLLGGYFIKNTQDGDSRFSLSDDFFGDKSNLGTIIQPINADTGTYYTYQEGEGFFLNLNLVKDFDDTDTLVQLPSTSMVNLYVFSGTYENFVGAEGEGITMTGSYSGDRAVSVKLVAPEDDYVYMFYLVIYDVSLKDFGLWVVPSYYEYDIKKLECEDSIELGEKKSVELGSNETEMTLIPHTTEYANEKLTITNLWLTHAIMYEVQLNEGQSYAAVLDSTAMLGGRAFLLDENKDKIGDTFIGSGAPAGGVPYNSCPLFITPVATGTYYIVLSGFYYNDKGNMSIVVDNLENMNLGGTFDTRGFTINLSSLGTTSDDSNDPHYRYEWVASASVGILTLYYPTDTFTLTGDNINVIVDVYNGVNVVMKDCTVGATWLANGWGSAKIKADGDSVINGDNENASQGYAFYNYETCCAGVYFTGENLTIEGPLGCVVTNAPVHLSCEKYSASASGLTGSITIATWVIGMDNPQFTIKEPYTLEDDLMKTTMYHDSTGYFIHGYTFSVNDEIYHYGPGTPKYDTIAAEVTLSTKAGGDTTPTPENPTPTPENPTPTPENPTPTPENPTPTPNEPTPTPVSLAVYATYEPTTNKANVDVKIDEKSDLKNATIVLLFDNTHLTFKTATAGEVMGSSTLKSSVKDGELTIEITGADAISAAGVLFKAEFDVEKDYYGLVTFKLRVDKIECGNGVTPAVKTTPTSTIVGVASSFTLGDVNSDGKVNTGDATFVLKAMTGAVTLDETQEKAADFNGDGKVNTGDATALLKYLAAN